MDLTGRTILIADDDADIRALLEAALTAMGGRVLEADSGADAVETARHHLPDLVILDVMMAGDDDGYRAFRQLRSDPLTHQIPIIMLTAVNEYRLGEIHSGESMAARFGQGEPEAFLEKPFQPSTLENMLMNLFPEG